MALEKFCFCCKPRNGAVILGTLFIILNSILLITTLASDTFTNHNQFYGSQTTPLYWFISTTLTIDLISSILLVVGAVKSKHFLMLPWIIVNGIVMIPFAIATFGIVIAGMPIFGPVYIWWCVCSAYQKVQETPPLPHNNFVSLSSSDCYPSREI